MATAGSSIGAAELDVLEFVSDDFPVSVRDVVHGLQSSHGYARTTVLTVLERLRQKGYVNRERIDGIYAYRPSIAPRRLMNQVVGRFVDEMLSGQFTPLIAYICKSNRLTAEEINSLTLIAKKLDSTSTQ